MTTLSELKAFDLDEAEVAVWVFKRPRSGGRRRFSGRWIDISVDLADRLRETVRGNLEAITETIEYDILAANNEASALTIGADETDAHLIATQIMDPTPDLKARSIPELRDSDFYVARFAFEGTALLAVRKTDQSWSTRRSRGVIQMVFSDEELRLEEDATFTIRSDFDFFVLGTTIFVRTKSNFESLMSYKAAHTQAFETLTAEVAFQGLFVDMAPLMEFVGTNKMHLRRAVAIQQKGHYRDRTFMTRLRAECEDMNLDIKFDEDGKIIATVESGKDIFLALLDHRLESRLTALMYDVPSTEQVT